MPEDMSTVLCGTGSSLIFCRGWTHNKTHLAPGWKALILGTDGVAVVLIWGRMDALSQELHNEPDGTLSGLGRSNFNCREGHLKQKEIRNKP